MRENHKQLSAYLDQARSRASLVEVLVHKGDRLSDVMFGRVASASPHGVELNLRGTAGVTIYFDFSDAVRKIKVNSHPSSASQIQQKSTRLNSSHEIPSRMPSSA